MKLFFELNGYLKKYKWKIALGVVFIIISKVFSIYPAQLIRQSFDAVGESVENFKMISSAEESAIYKHEITQKLTKYILFILGAALINGIFLFLTRQTIIVVSRKIEYDIKNQVYKHYQELHQGFYKKNNTGDIMNRISEDVSRVRMYFGPAIMYSINLITLFVLVISTMVSVNLKLTLYCLTPLPLLAIIIYYVSNTIHKKSTEVQRQLSNLSTISQETFSGIRILKAYFKVNFFQNKFESEANTYKDTFMGLATVNALFMPVMTMLIGLSTILTIYIGGKLAIEGEITAGNIAEFVIYVNMLTWPVASLGWVTSLIQRAMASYERIRNFLDVEPHIKSHENAEPFELGDIKFNDVSITYEDTNIQALNKVSFTIKQGQTIGIVGKTGSGKSTIANLIARLYDPIDGEITLADKNLKKINLNELRENIGYVPQEVFLFSDSILNNITFGLKTEVDESLVIQAAKDAHIHHNITDLPNKYNTVLGERGINLSGGQKQRISIARGIIKEPSILIFDDCLSAVDTETENEILNNLLRIMKDKTTVIISQRISAVKDANYTIVIDNGTIIQEGKHHDLINREGMYKELYVEQQ